MARQVERSKLEKSLHAAELAEMELRSTVTSMKRELEELKSEKKTLLDRLASSMEVHEKHFKRVELLEEELTKKCGQVAELMEDSFRLKWEIHFLPYPLY